MSLDLGELVGTLRMDVTPFDQALAHGESALNSFAGTAKAAAKNAGTEATAGLDAGLAGMEGEARSSASGVAAALGSELGAMDAEARAAGSAAAAGLGAGLDGAEAEAKAAGSKAGKGFSDEFKDGAKTAGMAAGAGVGAAIGVGIVDNMSVEAGLNKVAVQLGLSHADMKVAGQLAGNIYANNFGEDLPQINEALGHVIKNMNVELNSADLQPITEQVLTLTDAFDQDLGMTTAAVGQMIRTGMVKDAQEGLDVLTRGLQTPANKADDLMETMNEYGTQFRNLGLDGKDAMGLLSQGLQGGARDADIVADAMKEFSLKTQGELLKVTQTVDGPKHSLTALGEAFRAAGYDAMDGNKGFDAAHKIQAEIAAGGPKARKGLQAMLEGLRDTKDPLEQSRNAVALFGTQAEDMGDALYELDLSKTSKELGKVEGASKAAVDQMGSGAQATIDSYGRKLVEMGRDAIDALGPVGSVAGAVVGILPAVASVVGPVVGSWLAMSGASVTGALTMAGAWLIAIAPIAIVIAAVAGVAFLVYKYWDEIKEYTGKAWGWVVDNVKKVPGLLVGFFLNFTLVGLMIKHWDDIKEGVKNKGGQMIDWVKGVPDKVVNAIGNAGTTLKQKGKDLLQGLKDGAEDKWAIVSGWVGGLPERAINSVGNVAGTLKDKGRDLLQGLKDGAEEKWATVKEWVSGLPAKVLSNFGDGLTLLKTVGENVVKGMWDGISSMTTWLKEKVWDWVKSVLPGPVEKALGIDSPSKLFRNMMKWVPVGAALGIDDGTPILADAVGDMIDSVSGVSVDAATFASGAPGTIPESAEVATYGASRGAVGTGVTQHIYETTDARATAAESARRLALAGAGA